jgi:RNA polymerase sigma-70 factor, ECF subfamily
MSSFPDIAMPEVLIAPEALAEATAVYADWTELVARIRLGGTDGMEELYQLFSRGIRIYLASQIGPDELESRVHDTLVAVMRAIRRDELKDPERLMGFVRAIVRRQAAAQGTTESVVSSELREENPEEAAAFHRRTESIDRVLAELSQRERDILTRYYLREQSQDQICRELNVTETQFHLLRSAARLRYLELRRAEAGKLGPYANPALDVEQIVPVVAHAVAVFGDEKKASHWLATPLPLLGDRSPSQLLEDQVGIELVEQVLTRIEHNIPS